MPESEYEAWRREWVIRLSGGVIIKEGDFSPSFKALLAARIAAGVDVVSPQPMGLPDVPLSERGFGVREDG